jgi:hypothetical protein
MGKHKDVFRDFGCDVRGGGNWFRFVSGVEPSDFAKLLIYGLRVCYFRSKKDFMLIRPKDMALGQRSFCSW